MTEGRKWVASEGVKGGWLVYDSERERDITIRLTESEARDIAAIDDIKAERDEAVAFLRKFVGWFDGSVKKAPVHSSIAFLTSIKEQGDG